MNPALRTAFEKHVQYTRGVLRICDDLYQLDRYSRVQVIAFGKSAHDMATLLAEQIGTLATGILSAPQAAADSQLRGFRYFHGGHPLPNKESHLSAEAMLKSLTSLGTNALVIY